MNTKRYGLTHVELLAVVGIAGILLALLIPAVQGARESARRFACQNNLKQTAMAILNSESTHGSLPSLYNCSFLKQPRSASDEFHFHSWRVAILPFIEQSVIFDRIDFGRAATDPGNLKNIATSIPVFRCPSTNSPSVTVPEIGVFPDGGSVVNVIGPAARSDYEAVLGLLPDPVSTSLLDMLQRARFGPWGGIRYLPMSTAITGARIASYKDGRLRDTIDGLSQTILVGERSGRPDYYDDGKLIDAFPYVPPNDQKIDSQQAAWCVSTHFPQLLFEPHQSINDSNYGGLFGFHKSGANVALADGSVRLLSVSTSTTTLNALVTRANQDQGEIE